MPVNLKSMALNSLIAGTTAGTATTVYTANNGIGQIDQATAYNSDAAAITLYIYILPSGTAATAVDPIDSVSVPAGQSVILNKLISHKVPSLGSVQCYAGTTNKIRVSLSGVEVQ